MGLSMALLSIPVSMPIWGYPTLHLRSATFVGALPLHRRVGAAYGMLTGSGLNACSPCAVF